MLAFLPLALVLAAPSGLPDHTIDFSVTNASIINVHNLLAGKVGRPIDAACLMGKRMTLSVTNCPYPVLFDLLAARLNVTYVGTPEQIRLVCPGQQPDKKPKPTLEIGGATLVDLPSTVRNFLTEGKDAGLLVREVVPDQPSWISGVRVGDLLLEADGVRLAKLGTLAKLFKKKKGPIQSFEFLLVRGGESIRMVVVLKPENKIAP